MTEMPMSIPSAMRPALAARAGAPRRNGALRQLWLVARLDLGESLRARRTLS